MFRNLLSGSTVRNFVFGIEDSLVSTVGLLSGIATAGAEPRTILLTGVVLIFVEAFSMAIGSFLSDQMANEFVSQKDFPIFRSLPGGLIMFFSYFVSGFIPLAPYVFFVGDKAFTYSIGASLITLFILGVFGSSLSKVNLFKGGLRMTLMGGVAITIGVIVGRFFTI